jgi:DNA-binding NtrC family response regulator
MAATHRDLEAALAAREFRSDLYYRLAVISLLLPPLRERREDIQALVELFLDRFRAQLGRPVEGVSPRVLVALSEYSWPGNVRELINVIERAVLLCPRAEISLDELPAGFAGAGLLPVATAAAGRPPSPDWLDKPLRDARREAVRELEQAYLEAQLRRTGGRIAATAERAGLTPRSLYEKMRALGLRKEDFRPSTRSGRSWRQKPT